MKKLLILTTVILTATLIPSLGFVSATENIDEAIQQKEDEREQKESELEQSKQREYAYMQEGLSINEKLAALEGDLEGLQEEIEQDREELKSREEDVEAKMDDISAKQEEVAVVTKSLYKTSRMSIVETLLSSGGVTDVLRQLGFRRFGIGHMLDEARGYQSELADLSAEYNDLSDEIATLDVELEELAAEVENLENQKIAYQQMAAAEAAKQQSLVGQIANITAEQQALLIAKMQATDEGTTVGEYEIEPESLPDAPFSPAYAVASVGIWHRVGMSQYGAYGRAQEGQNYKQILKAYYNAVIKENFQVPERIYVSEYGWMDFEDEYMRGIAEMPSYWGDSGGYEALKAQAVAARSYAIHSMGDGSSICGDSNCQNFLPSKVDNTLAANWHRAVSDTRGEVLIDTVGNAIAAYYIMTPGGYTRLPRDFDVRWSTNYEYLKRTKDFAPDGKAYDGPGHADCPWYHKVWFCTDKMASEGKCSPSDIHPWLTQAEIEDMLNSALLSHISPEKYNKYLSNPSLGGWSFEKVRAELLKNEVTPISGVTKFSMIDSDEGYTKSIVVHTNSGLRDVDGISFYDVYRLRSRGNLWLKSGRYNIVVQ